MRTGFIDWMGERICLYVFEGKAENLNISETRCRELTEGHLKKEDIESILIDNLDETYLSLPSEMLSLRILEFPFSEDEKVRETLRYELEGILIESVDSYCIDHRIIHRSESGCKVIAVCIEKSRLREIIDTMNACGLDPAVVTSLDIRLSGHDIEKLMEPPVYDEKTRIEIASKEIRDHTINLRQDELSYTGDIEITRKNLRITLVLVFILTLLLSAHFAINFIHERKTRDSISADLVSLYRSVFPEDKKIINPYAQFMGRLKDLKKKQALISGHSVLDILLDISSLKSERFTLHEFSTDSNNLILKGTATAFEDVESLKDSLSERFHDVKITDSKSTTDGKIMFTILIKERGS